MLFVPWRYISDWRCLACGNCCKSYSVVLSFPEWLSLVKNYGVEKTIPSLNRLLIRRRGDGSCLFLYRFSATHFCALQKTKPKACKLWPFKILSKPKYGYPYQAAYRNGDDRFFIYADYNCSGLTYGEPSPEFANHTLREFVEIASGQRRDQTKTTGRIDHIQPYVLPRI